MRAEVSELVVFFDLTRVALAINTKHLWRLLNGRGNVLSLHFLHGCPRFFFNHHVRRPICLDYLIILIKVLVRVLAVILTVFVARLKVSNRLGLLL